jgi:hypothetical protein
MSKDKSLRLCQLCLYINKIYVVGFLAQYYRSIRRVLLVRCDKVSCRNVSPLILTTVYYTDLNKTASISFVVHSAAILRLRKYIYILIRAALLVLVLQYVLQRFCKYWY